LRLHRQYARSVFAGIGVAVGGAVVVAVTAGEVGRTVVVVVVVETACEVAVEHNTNSTVS
jgi:hypothetical protein